MNWAEVGKWLKENAGIGATLVGSLLTGNVPGAVAAGVRVPRMGDVLRGPAARLVVACADA